MAIQFQCDNCGKSLKTDDSKAGRRVKCPECENVLTIPTPEDDYEVSQKREAPRKRRAAVDDDDNPYRAPQSFEDSRGRSDDDDPDRYTLAGPGRRFIGAFLDNLCGLAFCLPGVICVVVGGGLDDNPDTISALSLIGIGLVVLGFLAWAVVSIYLLTTRSQSLAKYLLRMQILDYETKQPASFMKCAVIRSFVSGLIGAIPFIGAFYSLADALFVFSAEHRCLHDQLAGTYVVNLP